LKRKNLFCQKNLTIISQVLTALAKNDASVPNESIYFKQQAQNQLKNIIATNQKILHEQIVTTESEIIQRTQARNAKQSSNSVEEMTADRAEKLEAQVKAWRSLLPGLIKRFSKINDPRRIKKIKHKLAVVLLYGLFAFIFR